MTLKDLPRDADNKIIYGPFQGKTKKWIIRNPLDGIGIYRFSELDRLKGALGYSSSFQEIYALQEQRLAVYHKDTPNDQKLRILQTLDLAFKDKIVDLSKKQPHLMITVCSLFIVAEDEDLTKWNPGLVQPKQADWAEYNEWDFFELALITLAISTKEYTRHNQSIAQEMSQIHDSSTVKDTTIQEN